MLSLIAFWAVLYLLAGLGVNVGYHRGLSNREGWHANHHAYPWSARLGLARGQFDWTWQIVRLLRGLGLATAVRTAPEHPS